MAPTTSRSDPRAMPPTSGPKVSLKRGTRLPKKAWLSSATMLRESHASVLGVRTPGLPKRCCLSACQGDGKAGDGLAGLMAWRGGHKASDLKAGASRKISQIALGVTPAALGTEFESGCVRLFHGEKKETIRMEAGMGGLKHSCQITQIYERVGRQDQVVSESGSRKCGLQIGNGQIVINISGSGFFDHGGRQIDPVQPGGPPAESHPRQAGAAAQIEDRKLAFYGRSGSRRRSDARHHHRRQVQQDLRRGIAQLADH